MDEATPGGYGDRDSPGAAAGGAGAGAPPSAGVKRSRTQEEEAEFQAKLSRFAMWAADKEFQGWIDTKSTITSGSTPLTCAQYYAQTGMVMCTACSKSVSAHIYRNNLTQHALGTKHQDKVRAKTVAQSGGGILQYAVPKPVVRVLTPAERAEHDRPSEPPKPRVAQLGTALQDDPARAPRDTGRVA